MIVCFGLGVGLLVGLTGVGGGSLITPLLILVLGVKPTLAIGTDLAYGALTKTLGAWRHLKLRNVDLQLSLWLGLGSIPGSLLGVAMVGWLNSLGHNLDQILLRILGLSLFLVALSMVGRSLLKKSHTEREIHDVALTGAGKIQAIFIGLGVGLILGLTSVGSGALIGLALIVVFRLHPRRVVGTDVFHAAVLLWVAGLAHFALGHVDLRLVANLLVGSLPGVWVGSGWTERLSPLGLRLAIAGVLMASGLGLLSKSGLS